MWYSQLICVCCRRFLWWSFGLLVPTGSGRDGREWELGKSAMFCWRLWTEGLKDQLCGESQHPALYCSSPVIIKVIIEVVIWPLNPAVLSGSTVHNVLFCWALRDIKGSFLLFFLYCLKSPHCTIHNVFIRLLFSFWASLVPKQRYQLLGQSSQ